MTYQTAHAHHCAQTGVHASSRHAARAGTPVEAGPLEILEKLEVCEFLGVKKRCLEGMVLRQEFPPPVQLGRKVYWSRRAVEDWRVRRFAAQESWMPMYG